jgi:hypothetical protein
MSPRTTLTGEQCRDILPRIPPELQRLFLWLATGQDPAGKAAD